MDTLVTTSPATGKALVKMNEQTWDNPMAWAYFPGALGYPVISQDGEKLPTPPVPQTSKSRTTGTPFLDMLPTEGIHYVLSFCDVKSVTRLRQTSSFAAAIVDNYQPYREILNTAPAVAKLIQSVDVNDAFTIRYLHNTLKDNRCACCGKDGPLISLLTGTRACYRCLTISPTFRVCNYYDTINHLEKSRSDPNMRKCLKMKSYPGWYGSNRTRVRERGTVLAKFDDIAVTDEEKIIMLSDMTFQENEIKLRCMAAAYLPWLINEQQQIEADIPLCCLACAPRQFDKLRQDDDFLMSLSLLPKHIAGNEDGKTYTREEFVDHFRNCERVGAWKAWLESQPEKRTMMERMWARMRCN